jgi:hypothetical protein
MMVLLSFVVALTLASQPQDESPRSWAPFVAKFIKERTARFWLDRKFEESIQKALEAGATEETIDEVRRRFEYQMYKKIDEQIIREFKRDPEYRKTLKDLGSPPWEFNANPQINT